MKKVRVGIIGAGSVAQWGHLPAYAARENVEVVALADVNLETAKATAEKFGVPQVFQDYRKLLALEEIKAVSVCTHAAMHKPIAVAALQAGKHVLVEKPMAMNSAEGQAMVDAAKKAKRLLMVGFNYRFGAESQMLKRAIQAGALGEIYYAEATYTRRRGVPGKPGFIQKKLSGGGPLIDLGVHVLDLSLHFMGFPQPVAVSSVTYSKLGRRPHHAATAGYGAWDPKLFDVEDAALGLVRFRTGACLYLKTSWLLNTPQEECRVVLAGTAGGGQTDPLEICREEHGTLVSIKPSRLPKINGHHEEVRLFLEAIEKGLPSPVPGEEALITTKIVEAIYRSSRLGREVKIA